MYLLYFVSIAIVVVTLFLLPSLLLLMLLLVVLALNFITVDVVGAVDTRVAVE
jgi:hypothetical protein